MIIGLTLVFASVAALLVVRYSLPDITDTRFFIEYWEAIFVTNASILIGGAIYGIAKNQGKNG